MMQSVPLDRKEKLEALWQQFTAREGYSQYLWQIMEKVPEFHDRALEEIVKNELNRRFFCDQLRQMIDTMTPDRQKILELIIAFGQKSNKLEFLERFLKFGKYRKVAVQAMLQENCKPELLLAIIKKAPEGRYEACQRLLRKKKFPLQLLEFPELREKVAREMMKGSCTEAELAAIVEKVPEMAQRALNRLMKRRRISKPECMMYIMQHFPKLQGHVWNQISKTSSGDFMVKIMKKAPKLQDRVWTAFLEKEKQEKADYSSNLNVIMREVPRLSLRAGKVLLTRDNEYYLVNVAEQVPTLRKKAVAKILSKQPYCNYALKKILPFCSPKEKIKAEGFMKTTAAGLCSQILNMGHL